jgi:hypothetical protein
MTRRKKFLKTPAERQRVCRGNTTYGADRRGNKAGRRPAYPPDTVIWPWHLTLSDAHCRKAKALGHGNLAAGIRKALDRTEAPARYANAPADMIGLMSWLALQKISNAVFSQEKLDYEDEQQENKFREEAAREARDDDEDERPRLGFDKPPVAPFDMFKEIENG